jgi:hypothetical protein
LSTFQVEKKGCGHFSRPRGSSRRLQQQHPAQRCESVVACRRVRESASGKHFHMIVPIDHFNQNYSLD